jgi:chemotaxis protein CheD
LDDCPRKVYFFPASGRVLVKKLRNMHNQTIADREQLYSNKLKSADLQGDVELF